MIAPRLFLRERARAGSGEIHEHDVHFLSETELSSHFGEEPSDGLHLATTRTTATEPSEDPFTDGEVFS